MTSLDRLDAEHWLRERAHAYHSDALAWKRDPTLLGITSDDGLDWHQIYLTVADELRRCAQEMEQ